MGKPVGKEHYPIARRHVGYFFDDSFNLWQRIMALKHCHHLIYTKGYERMTIQDLLGELQISKGAFYHYFDSKAAVLDGITERIRITVEEALLPIVYDPNLTAIEKFQRFFSTIDQIRVAYQVRALEMMRVWYADENAVVRQRVEDAVIEQRAPMLNEIVRQGIAEGVFTPTRPERSGEVVLALLEGMGHSHMKLFLALDQGADEKQSIDEIITVYHAYMEAIERALGAPAHSLRAQNLDAAMVKGWIKGLRSND